MAARGDPCPLTGVTFLWPGSGLHTFSVRYSVLTVKIDKSMAYNAWLTSKYSFHHFRSINFLKNRVVDVKVHTVTF